jgi:hypothetical protein
MPEARSFDRFLVSVFDALDRSQAKYALVVGLAVSAYARPRATKDVDVLLGGPSASIARPEHLIVLKAVAGREIDGKDVEDLIQVAGPELDRSGARLRSVAAFVQAATSESAFLGFPPQWNHFRKKSQHFPHRYCTFSSNFTNWCVGMYSWHRHRVHECFSMARLPFFSESRRPRGGPHSPLSETSSSPDLGRLEPESGTPQALSARARLRRVQAESAPPAGMPPTTSRRADAA